MAQDYHLIPRLSENANFGHWKFRVKLMLEEKGVLYCVEDAAAPKEAKASGDAKARSIIVQCLSDRYIEIVKNSKTAADMLSKLEDIFERKTVCNKLRLKRQLIMLKCSASEKLQDYFLKFDSLVGELSAIGCEVDKMDQVCYLLSSLPPAYENVITSIETMITEKSIEIETIKARLLDAELKQCQENNHEEAFLVCYGCGKHGHLIKNCRDKPADTYSYNRGYRGRPHSRGYRSNRGYRGPRNNSRGRGMQQRHSSHVAQAEDDHHDVLSFTAFSTGEQCLNVSNDVQFIVDSGATENLLKSDYERHMTSIVELDKAIKVFVANGQYLTCYKRGTLNLMCNNVSINVEGLIVPNLSHNLLSVRKLLEKGYNIQFTKNNVSISNKLQGISGNLLGNLYVIPMQLKSSECLVAANDVLWHQRLGHANRKHLKIMGLPCSETPCEPCMQGKSTRLPFYSTPKPRSQHIGELIHTDLSGPVSTPTSNGEAYYQTIIDDYTHFCEVYLLKRKSEATGKLIEYVSKIERQTGYKVKKIRADNGGEFKNDIIQNFCKKNGIAMQYTIPYSPKSNGVAERMNRTIYNRARTLLLETGLPKTLWGEAVRCSVYQINRCPSSAIRFNTPAEKMFGDRDLLRLRVFGSKVWVHILPKQDKLEERARSMRFVGYSPNGYRVWNPESNEITVARDVRFDESQFKYIESKPKEKDLLYRYNEEEQEAQESDRDNKNEETERKEGTSQENQEDERYYTDEESIEENRQETKECHTRSGREVRKPKELLDHYDLNYTAYCLLSGDPQEFDEAIQNEEWEDAIKKELESQRKMATWEEATLPKGSKAIDTKWIFRTKQDNTKKARLVAKGYQQNNSYNNYAPVAKLSTIRLMLSIAVLRDEPLEQLDVPTAFLNGDLDEEVYIKCPKGLKIEEGKVLRLKKALYGLKEAPKCWNKRFHEFIIGKGYSLSKHDSCLYRKNNTWILLYVDDILLLGESVDIISQLRNEFKVKELGEVKNYLGLEITRKKDRMEIRQSEMIHKLLVKFNMQDCKKVNTPMEVNYSADTDSEVIDVPFKELVGSLLYISTNSRPDITFAVCYLSRFLDKPTEDLWKAGKRILRYLKGTPEKGLLFKRCKDATLVAYSDADWAADKTDRKSTSGCAIFHGENLITWFSRKQTCTALSTAEAEFVAGAHTVSEVMHIKGLLTDFSNNETVINTHLFIDNQSTIKLIENQSNTKASKHISIKYHYIKDIINKKLVSISYVPTEENVSDILTKSLPAIKHMYFINKLNLV